MKGLLLLNLGTPDGPSPAQVRRYLEEFLMDPEVVDIPYPLRWLFVHALILPRRSVASAELYKKIWTSRGSPLLLHLQDLAREMRPKFTELQIEIAMRYGSPSIGDGLSKLRACDSVLVLPLYPQYSLSATRSSVTACREWAVKNAPSLKLEFFPAFYDREPFLDAFAARARATLEGFRHDRLLFSFHGLPKRQVKSTDRGDHCFRTENCCDRIVEANRDCYRAQCYATARGIAARLGLGFDPGSVCFQSRLGRTPWIRPHTDVMILELARAGVKRIAVACPSFVADCLETLEEIAIRNRKVFLDNGGEELKLIPSLNASPEWVNALVMMINETGALTAGAWPGRPGDEI